MMVVNQAVIGRANSAGEGFGFDLDEVVTGLVGPLAGWFRLEVDGDWVFIRPQKELQRRCTIRPVAIFEHERGFFDANTVMGRMVFSRGEFEAKRYRPFTLDTRRTLRELYFLVEAMPEDEWPVSVSRWTNHQAVVKRLLSRASVTWDGIATADIERLVRFVVWPEVLEGCVLHALAQWSHAAGDCLVEVGSYRGRSLSMFGMALGEMGVESLLMSIDPHDEEPCNAEHVRTMMRQLGEEKRLVQMRCGSDEAWRVLRGGSASMVFIDGEHSYEQVVRDFMAYKDIVGPGGVLAFHDYGYGEHNGLAEADPDVRRAVDERVFSSGEFRPLLLGQTVMAFVKGG